MSTIADHLARDFVGYGRRPPGANWPNAARLALNFVINVEEGAEQSVPDGDRASETALADGVGDAIGGRDLAAESVFEYGSRVGFWRIENLFRPRRTPVTVFACAQALERNPEICEAIREQGYDVCAHGLRWIQHRELSIEEERRQIAEAVASIAQSIGTRPQGWYCRYGPGINTRMLIVEEGGFLYDSDAYNDDLPYWRSVAGRPHLVLPYTRVHNDAQFLRGNMATGVEFFSYLRDAFDFLLREGETQPRMMTVGVHSRIMGHPGRAAGLERFIDYVARHSGVWICRRIDIAKHWACTHPSPTQ
jgi:allantoinase